MIVTVSCPSCDAASEASTTLFGGFVPCHACGEDLSGVLKLWVRTSPQKPPQGPYTLEQIQMLVAEEKVRERMLFSGDGERWESGTSMGGIFRPVTAAKAKQQDARRLSASPGGRIGFCERCSEEMPWGARQCRSCGARQQAAAGAAQRAGPSGSGAPPVNVRCPACAEPILAAARKCKHCGEWLATESGDSQHKPRLAGDGHGPLLLFLPLGGAVLALLAVFAFRAFLLAYGVLWLSVLVSGVLVGFDLQRLRRGAGPSDGSPMLWALFAVLLWFIGYPMYLGWRSRYGGKNLLVGGILVTVFVCLVWFAMGNMLHAVSRLPR